MGLEEAISMLKKTVKNNSTNDNNHIDFGLVPVSERPQYEKALRVVRMAIMEGKISQEDFVTRVHLE